MWGFFILKLVSLWVKDFFNSLWILFETIATVLFVWSCGFCCFLSQKIYFCWIIVWRSLMCSRYMFSMIICELFWLWLNYISRLFLNYLYVLFVNWFWVCNWIVINWILWWAVFPGLIYFRMVVCSCVLLQICIWEMIFFKLTWLNCLWIK